MLSGNRKCTKCTYDAHLKLAESSAHLMCTFWVSFNFCWIWTVPRAVWTQVWCNSLWIRWTETQPVSLHASALLLTSALSHAHTWPLPITGALPSLDEVHLPRLETEMLMELQIYLFLVVGYRTKRKLDAGGHSTETASRTTTDGEIRIKNVGSWRLPAQVVLPIGWHRAIGGLVRRRCYTGVWPQFFVVGHQAPLLAPVASLSNLQQETWGYHKDLN